MTNDPKVSWDDVRALPEFRGNAALAEGCWESGHSLASIQTTLAICGNPIAAAPQPKASAMSPAYAAALQSINADSTRRASIMALPDAQGREALAERLFNDGKSVDEAKDTLAGAAGWRKVVDRLNGKPVEPQANHGWSAVFRKFTGGNSQ